MAVATTCGGCGHALRADAKFCDECGNPVATASPAMYKQVTVLFADVVRSMAMAAVLDLERLREIMAELVERAATVVERYGGTVEYNGDGVMALFGAPMALEDHAFRGCLAALAIQDEANRLATDVRLRDDVTLQLRIGLNSGRVIAGDLGAKSARYAATGATVGFAQRMEAAARPGEVMLSDATARLVEGVVILDEPEWLRVKNSDEPVRGHRLISISPRTGTGGRSETELVGRRWELAAIDAMMERAVDGHGGAVTVVGPPGIGKSRIAREAAALAARRGVEVSWVFCESHVSDVPFAAVTRLLRAGGKLAGLDDATARKRLRALVPPDADPTDLLLLDDFLDVADPEAALPQIDPDARRRRLTGLVNATSLAREEPALVIIEDAHWIDRASESMLADFLGAIARTRLMVLVTARPDSDGALTRARGAHAITLAPLADSDIDALLAELLGADPSVAVPARVIAERAAGNPFFAEELVRDLAQRGVLEGERGRYVCRTHVSGLDVPATVQAVTEARIDRLSDPARRTLSAASVIGTRFDAELLHRVGVDPAFDELLDAELVDQVGFTPTAEYAFRHPLIRAVTYEAQLKSDRAQWHSRLALAIRERDQATDENAAVIAEHHAAAGELREAYHWHMRAAARATSRDVGAARASWERACHLADQLPGDEPQRLSMRIAPRTMLRATDWLSGVVQDGWGAFAELEQLCREGGDDVSLAIGMTGLTTELLYTGRPGEGSRMVVDQIALLDSIGDPALTVGLAFGAFTTWFNSGEFDEILHRAEYVIGLEAGDARLGGAFGIGSPLAVALAFRGIARSWLGRGGWNRDLDDAIEMARHSDPTTFALVVSWCQIPLIYGLVEANDAMHDIVEEAAALADACSNDFAVAGARFTLGIDLLHRHDPDDRRRGRECMVGARDEFLPLRAPSLVPLARIYVAREDARRGDYDGALAVMRAAVAQLHEDRRIGWLVCGADILVQTLLDRATEGDLVEAGEQIGRLAELLAGTESAVVDITLARLRALRARASRVDQR